MTLLNLLAVSIGIGLVFTVLLTEAFGLAAGGLVVPGYVALKVLQPWDLVITLLAAYLAFVVVRTLSGFLVIYGRRRTALTILTGYLIGSLGELAFGGGLIVPAATANPGLDAMDAMNAGLGQDAPLKYLELGVIGYIIPGLIAIWFDRQGVVRTLTGLILTASLVRLSLVVIMPEALAAYELNQAAHMPSLQDTLNSVTGGSQ
ncbi:poly-gamma-glutamate biosynthesis protein PgsC/CapC [Rhodothalassium salexigens DSM 2132]|uniref:Poly-gamma-glutamate biosynthesis protein PgsC/CapC n=1 Tax=Rhodothalassium salexigens DSM 2132 TaxID=1188247 RepID=A0A4R2PTR2_RHOSA|nr:poly-gamma-glutamate biosynthesis protein PgsC [Rhodothalassium salexigens]MBB4210370.1 poly-gamma-glutamate biosynthesis protein PgsC/CapC [Rhodothalassium salexigens DSM 2132]MBK1638572.1 poly-gamma-glutamate biosynthesis protein PgsC [Rhodothalassium salexigens DSM 2132]TCP38534.1 poly-gamma-glutamate biosynthesis protein PgsC/CapC [Rhodothalassium salexigens DSM 2132]